MPFQAVKRHSRIYIYIYIYIYIHTELLTGERNLATSESRHNMEKKNSRLAFQQCVVLRADSSVQTYVCNLDI